MDVEEATGSFDNIYCNEFVDEDPSDPYSPGVGNVFLFSKEYYNICSETQQIYSTSALSVRSSDPDFSNVVDRLQEHFRIGEGDFSIHAVSHSWFGNASLEEFVSLMTNPQYRYQNTPDEVETHSTDSAIFVAPVISGEPSEVVIHALPLSGSGNVFKFGVHFIMSGIPLNSEQYIQFADDASLSFRPVREFHTHTEIVPARDAYPLKKIGDDHDVDSLWFSNPFHRNHALREDYIPDLSRTISGLKWIYSELRYTHPWEDEVEYKVDKFRIDHRPSGLPMPFGLVNVFLFTDY